MVKAWARAEATSRGSLTMVTPRGASKAKEEVGGRRLPLGHPQPLPTTVEGRRTVAAVGPAPRARQRESRLCSGLGMGTVACWPTPGPSRSSIASAGGKRRHSPSKGSLKSSLGGEGVDAGELEAWKYSCQAFLEPLVLPSDCARGDLCP